VNKSYSRFPKILKIEEGKIVLSINHSWAICLNANVYENSSRKYFLDDCLENRKKLANLSLLSREFLRSCKTKESSINSDLRLRQYQKEDIKFLSRLKSVAIFSEMRTGKTPIALTLFKKWKADNLLIIVPNIVQQQWQRSIKEWTKKSSYIITYLDRETRYAFYKKLFQGKDWIIIVSKDIFKMDSDFFKNSSNVKKKRATINHCVIVDEAHFLRNYKSQQSKSIYALKEADYKIVLTGTPIVNHQSDIFGILKFLHYNSFSSYWKFVDEFFDVLKTEVTKGKKKFKIFQVKSFKSKESRNNLIKIITSFSVNRRQKEVLPWLPSIIYQKEKLLMNDDQTEIYHSLVTKWQKYQPLEILAKLKTLTLFPGALGHKEKGVKIEFLVSYLKENEEKSIIIFSTRSDTFIYPLEEELKKENILVGVITGKTNLITRGEIINKFQNRMIKIILCNIQSVSVGVDLSCADTMIFADRSYSPADNEQAESRFIPTTIQAKKRVKMIIDLICKDTIDEKIFRLLKRKESITDVLNHNPNYFFD